MPGATAAHYIRARQECKSFWCDFGRFVVFLFRGRPGVDRARAAAYSSKPWQRRLDDPMLRLLIRFAGLILLAGGFAALIIDGTRSLAGGDLRVIPLGVAAIELFPLQTKAWQAAADRESLCRPDRRAAAAAPLSLTLTGLGGLLIAASRKRRRPIDFPAR